MLRRFCVLAVVAMLLIPAGALAQQQDVSIPEFSIIPLTMTSSLSSAVSNVGDRFAATCTGPQCCGFPSGTIFSGQVTRVVRATGRQPGQVAVQFDSARLPDGTCIRIKGALAGVAETLACLAPNSTCMIASHEFRGTHNSFIAGANCSIFIGTLCRGNIIIGRSTNVADICPPTGSIKAAVGQDVVVPAGTRIGMMFEEAACIPATSCPPVAAVPAPAAATGAGPMCTSTVLFSSSNQLPFTAHSSLMLPLRSVMDSTGMRYNIDPASNMVTFESSQGPVTHLLGSNVVTVNGQERQISGYSGSIGNVIYVPQDVISLGTGRAVEWNADAGILTLQ